MFKILGILILGLLSGRLIKDRKTIRKYVDKLIMLTIFLLLFLLGVSIGINDLILESLPTLGLKALLLTIGGVAGSIILAKFVFEKHFRSNKNQVK